MVKVYTMENCQPCKMTKRELDRLNIEYEEINMTSNPEELDTIRELGFMQAPVVMTPTSNWAGFSPTKIKALKEVE